VPADENRACVLGQGKLTETEELGSVEWSSSVDYKVNKMAPDKVPIESTDPRTRVCEKVSHIPARETHRRDDAEVLPI
jgi:hypothetical protein